MNNRNLAMSNNHEALEPKSKQQLKRDAEAAQTLGKALGELPAPHFNVLVARDVLPEKLCDALVEYRAIKAHEGRRRQLQFVGKLMRDVDTAPIQKILAEFERSGHVASAQLHDIERWRERLLAADDEALKALLQIHPEADAALLQKLIVSGRKEFVQKQPPRAARLLFRYLRDLLKSA